MSLQYSLAFVGGFKTLRETDGNIEVDVHSEFLDLEMHRERRARINLATRSTGIKGVPGFYIDAFQIASIEAYIREQAGVRKQIEERLIREREMLDNSSASASGPLWTQVNVIQVDIELRQVLTPEGLARMKKWYPDESEEAIVAKHDRPSTQSKFTVVINTSWDEDHQRWAQFRDGQLIGLSAE